MFTIIELDAASRRPIRRIPVLYTTENEANHYAVILNRRQDVAKLRLYVVQATKIVQSPAVSPKSLDWTVVK